MSQGFFDRDTLDGVECEKLLKQVKSQIRSLGEHVLEWDLLLERERSDIFPGTSRFDTVVVLHSRGAKDIQYQG